MNKAIIHCEDCGTICKQYCQFFLRRKVFVKSIPGRRVLTPFKSQIVGFLKNDEYLKIRIPATDYCISNNKDSYEAYGGSLTTAYLQGYLMLRNSDNEYTFYLNKEDYIFI